MKKKIKVNIDDDLVNYLTKCGIAKNKVKTYVKLGAVFVNDKCVKKLPYDVCIGDDILIDTDRNNVNLDIIYEDKNYLIVNKPNGLLTISTSKINKNIEITLYRLVREYLNNKHEFAFTVNRIDRDTSGIVVFVKQEWLKNKLQDNWNNIVKSRRYMALVSGKIISDGRIDNYLYEDKAMYTHSTNFGGKRAITNYEVVRNSDNYTLLDINIETGRKNQIRVHMSEMGHPIVGDKKYYSKDNNFKRLMLHHYEISFINPLDEKLLIFRSKIPCEFDNIFDNN